ncbi:hypothetical protein LguiA_014026 [Lonicera macranthoides]
MVSTSGASSFSSQVPEEGLMDQRKRKRMTSNRESARRSRMRKRKHLEDLVVQASQLSKENSHILTNMEVTSQLYVNIDAENSVLRAQMVELTHRLESLNEIISCLDLNNGFFDFDEGGNGMMSGGDEFLINPWNLIHVNQPIIASADMFMD